MNEMLTLEALVSTQTAIFALYTPDLKTVVCCSSTIIVEETLLFLVDLRLPLDYYLFLQD